MICTICVTYSTDLPGIFAGLGLYDTDLSQHIITANAVGEHDPQYIVFCSRTAGIVLCQR